MKIAKMYKNTGIDQYNDMKMPGKVTDGSNPISPTKACP